MNQVLLRLYEATQSTCVSEFPETVFSLIKTQLNFDSAAFCGFNQHPQSGLKLVSGVAHNLSVAEKLQARAEYINEEKIAGKNTLFTDDPALEQAYRRKGQSITLSVLNNPKVKPNVAAYGIKTESLQTLTMVNNAALHTSFQTISLWRSKSDFSYSQNDQAIANILLPHVFQAFSIHRQLHLKNQLNQQNNIDEASAICSVAGQIYFIDDAAFKFLQAEFHDWRALFLPSRLMDTLRLSSGNTYIGKQFTVVAQINDDLLFLKFRKTCSIEYLSPTELVVAEMLVRHETYKAIAQRLGNQPATVRNQAHSIYKKLGISGKAELASVFHAITNTA